MESREGGVQIKVVAVQKESGEAASWRSSGVGEGVQCVWGWTDVPHPGGAGRGRVVSDRAYLKGTGNADNCRTGRVWSLLQRAVGGSMRRTEAS